jgi:outer membrane protein insertion porin family
MRPHDGKEYTAYLQIAGLWGDVRYINPAVAYKRYIPMHYLMPTAGGHNVLAVRAQLNYIQGISGDVAPPNNRFFNGGEMDIRGFEVRSTTPYGYVPTRVNFQLTNPDGSCVPASPNNVANSACVQVPLPVYGIASIGGDASFTGNAEYRIPVVGPFTFAFFDDFGIDAAVSHNQLKQSPEGFDSLTAPLYGCPTVVNEIGNTYSCEGGISGSKVGFQRNIHPVLGTNFVPRMSTGAEISVLMPIINAPFRLYYAYNPLRLYERPYCPPLLVGGAKDQSNCNAILITPSLFPNASSNCNGSATNAGTYTYCEAIQAYGSQSVFREPRKTFRLTISTTF